MAANPCPNVLDCECVDFPIRNFTAEGPEPPFIGVVVPRPRPPLNQRWTSAACKSFCLSEISQADADDCARRNAQQCVFPPCVPPNVNCPELVCSDPVVGTFPCPDGSIYFFPLGAGAFCAFNLDEANAQAQSAANNRARLNHFCINVPCLSLCLDRNHLFDMPIDGGTGPFAIELFSGVVPDGLTVISDGRIIRLSGIPTTSGNQVFTLKISDGVGGYLLRSFLVSVLEITPATLPEFNVGEAYSQQLGVTGGSGHYAWKIISGSLPTGITLSVGGLLSGTPTSDADASFSVFVIDTDCEELNRTFFPPRVTLTGLSTTRIATVKGYREFIPSVPPRMYKKLSWEGTSQQTAFILPSSNIAFIDGRAIPISLPLGVPATVANAKYEWSGVGEIDNTGQQVSKYQKLFSAMCHPDRAAWGTDWPAFSTSRVNPVFPGGVVPNVLKGYCLDSDPKSCGTCSLSLQGDVADNSIFDGSDFLRSTNSSVLTALSFEARYTTPITQGVIGLTQVEQDFEIAYLQAVHNYSATLSDEYTDAIALANAEVFNTNGLTAENKPRTTGLVSSFTTTIYQLRFTNLLAGEDYTATVTLADSNGARTVRTYDFTAIDVTHTISDSIPNPAAGHSITARNPFVRFAD